MALTFNFFDSVEVDFESYGVLVRSWLHDRGGDPHFSFFDTPKPGRSNHSPHLSPAPRAAFVMSRAASLRPLPHRAVAAV
jgi:hypothetical protein